MQTVRVGRGQTEVRELRLEIWYNRAMEDWMKFIAPKRPLYLINGKRVRDLKVEISGHPKIPIEDYLFKTHRPVIVTATRYNGLLMSPEYLHIYKRKSGRDVIEMRFPTLPAR